MPPTVIVPWFTPCCGLDALLVAPAVPELFPAVEPPDLAPAAPAGAVALLVFPPAVGVAAGAAPLLAGAGAPVDPPLLLPPLGAAVPPELLGAAEYDCPATPPAVCWAAVELPRCEKSYAMAPPRARVASTFNVMNTIATRSRSVISP
jgi:hypothetical protein